MPRLFHRPPAYRLHKTTKQAVVSFFGKQVFLGPYGSQKSLERYQKLLTDWDLQRHRRATTPGAIDAEEAAPSPVIVSLTAAKLRERHKAGAPLTITELIFVYRRHTHEYYRKNGQVTREAGVIDDALRILRRHHGRALANQFGPVALDELREKMIDELDWS